MADKAPSTRKQIVILLVLVLTLTVALLAAIGFLLVNRGAVSPSDPLIGTWRSIEGNVINFRDDGTARFWVTDNVVGYFDWQRRESQELDVFQYSSKNGVGAWIARVRRATVGLQGEQYTIVHCSSERLQLRERDGTIQTFAAIRDEKLEKVP